MIWTAFAYTPSTMQTQMLTDLNTYRQGLGWQPALVANDALMQAAQDYACKLNDGIYPYQHVQPSGVTPQDRMIAAWYRWVWFWENLNKWTTRNNSSSMTMYTLWNSPGHKANIVNPLYTEVGVGQCWLYRVQNFWIAQSQTIINTGINTNTNTVSTNTVTNIVNTSTTTYTNIYMDEDWNILSEQEYLDLTNEWLSSSNSIITPTVIDSKSELETATTWMFTNGLTSKSNITDFLPDDTMTREEAAKFFGVFATTIYNKSEDSIISCSFSDIKKADSTLTSNITSACKLGIFKWYSGKFDPKAKLNNAQAVTVLMRIIVGTLTEPPTAYYTNYLSKAKEFWLVGNINVNSNITRWQAAILIYKANTYKEKLDK